MERLRRVFAIDLRRARGLCPHRGGRVRVIADVTRPDVIQRILAHVATHHDAPGLARGTADARAGTARRRAANDRSPWDRQTRIKRSRRPLRLRRGHQCHSVQTL